jgi:alpha-tubulin suppressor-like RCC1 family protein
MVLLLLLPDGHTILNANTHYSIGTGRNATAIKATNSHVCIVAASSNTTSDTSTAVSDSNSGDVLCWGSGALGQLVSVTVALCNRKVYPLKMLCVYCII